MAPPTSSQGVALLTDKEQRLAALMIMCMEDAPKINYQKVAELGGYTEASARTLIGMLKRKLKTLAGDADGDAPAAAGGGTPKRKKQTKKRVATTDDDEEEEVKVKSPKKKTKAMKAEKAEDTIKSEEDAKNGED